MPCGGRVCRILGLSPLVLEERARAFSENGDNRLPADVGAESGAMMVLKRSVSPDGRIDSVSVEVSTPIGKAVGPRNLARAHTLLEFQEEVANDFLRSRRQPSPGNGASKPPVPQGNGQQNGDDFRDLPDPVKDAVPARLVAVGAMQTKWGRRLFIDVQVDGKTLKFFGTPKQLMQAVSDAGYQDVAGELGEGVRLDLPCRVMTKPSPDGKYVNIERVLPAESRRPR